MPIEADEANGIYSHCICGYEYKHKDEWCPRCHPDKQPQTVQLSLDLNMKEK